MQSWDTTEYAHMGREPQEVQHRNVDKLPEKPGPTLVGSGVVKVEM